MGETASARWIRTIGPTIIVLLALAVLVFAAFGSNQDRGPQLSFLPLVLIPAVWSSMLLSDAAAFARRRVAPWFLLLVLWALIAGWTAAAVGDGSPTAVAICGVAAVLCSYPLWRVLERARARQRAEHDTRA